MADAAKKKTRLEMQAAAQEYAGLAFKTIVNIARTGETDKDRLNAAKEILDRAYGKPIQGHQLEPENPNELDEVSDRAERFTRAIVGLAARRGTDRAIH